MLSDLMNRADVDSLVCATDAGREGELIFRLVYQQAGCRKPMERLWISSMEEDAIKAGFSALRPSSEYDLLYAAALCRAKADWLVGITGTRLFSTLYRRTLNVGRVMTPTLALVVERETAIDSFKRRSFTRWNWIAVFLPQATGWQIKGSGETESCLCRPDCHCPKGGEKAAQRQPAEAI